MNAGSAAVRTLFLTIDWILGAIVWFVFIWVILSWIVFFTAQSSFRWKHRSAFNILVQLDELFSRLTTPLLRPFRRLLPPYKTAGIDWSPMLLLLAVYIVRTFLRLWLGPMLF